MPVAKEPEDTVAVPDLAQISEGVFRSSDEAAATLSQEERDAFNEARQSVVDARQRAEAVEGLLRIH
jgi:hypothetical protein